VIAAISPIKVFPEEVGERTNKSLPLSFPPLPLSFPLSHMSFPRRRESIPPSLRAFEESAAIPGEKGD